MIGLDDLRSQVKRAELRHCLLVEQAARTGDWYRADKHADFLVNLQSDLRIAEQRANREEGRDDVD
jgi:hypothetical protein